MRITITWDYDHARLGSKLVRDIFSTLLGYSDDAGGLGEQHVFAVLRRRAMSHEFERRSAPYACKKKSNRFRYTSCTHDLCRTLFQGTLGLMQNAKLQK